MLNLAVHPFKVTDRAFECEWCTWFRDYTPTTVWLETTIEHPRYGPIVQKDLVIRDIQEHNCRDHSLILEVLAKGWM